MNVLILSTNFPPVGGGIASFVQNIANELSRCCHKITVLSGNYCGENHSIDIKQKFPVYRFKNFFVLKSLSVIFLTLYLALIKKPEVIFLGSFLSTYGIGVVLVKKILRIPYVILIHGNEMTYYFKSSGIDRWASNQLLHHADHIIANSFATKKVIESYGYSSKNMSIIHPAIEPQNFKAKNKNLDILSKYILQNKKILLSVSRLVPVKNHENVIKALPSVIRKVPNLTYIIVGEGPEKEKLQRLAKDLGLGSFVRFLGYIDPEKIPSYFNICDVFIMPSKKVSYLIDREGIHFIEEQDALEMESRRLKKKTKIGYLYESFGIVFLEANACGKPVIGSTVGGIKEAIIDGETGLLVDPHDTDEIAGAIIRLLTDYEYAQKLGSYGRRRVEGEFNCQALGVKVENVLEQVASRTYRKQ